MAPHLDAARKLFWILMKSLLRFTFMFVNNCVAIPSYCLYLIVLQPLRVLDAHTFWYIEGIMFRWLLAMVASWGWCAGYTGKTSFFTLKNVPYVGLHSDAVEEPLCFPQSTFQ